MALDKKVEVFVVYMTSFKLNLMPIHLVQKAQIALLIAKEVKILIKYLDFLNVFLKKKALVLLETAESNQYVIKFQKI